MKSVLNSFRRLLISTPALNLPLGQRQTALFRGAALLVREYPTDAELLTDIAIGQPGTLAVMARPSAGWITVADFGALATRRGERYLHPITGCQSACTYCYLRGKDVGLRPLRFHVDTAGLLSAIDCDIEAADSNEPLLYSTGELADSLGDEDLFPIAAILAAHFGKQRRARLELRTKSNRIETLMSVPHGGMTTVAFSLAPQTVIDRHEPGTSSLSGRLNAARRCQDAGYPIAFKFEPLILASGWLRHYEEMLSVLSRSIDVQELNHVSVGCLRWSEALANVPPFAKQYGPDVESGEWIEYRPGVFNGTIARKARSEVYRQFLRVLRLNGIRAPIWWSLEESDLIAEVRDEDTLLARPNGLTQ